MRSGIVGGFLSVLCGALGLAAALRALLVLGVLVTFGAGEETFWIVVAAVDVLALTAIATVFLVAGVTWTSRPAANRRLVQAVCGGAIVVTVADLLAWRAYSGTVVWSDDGVIGAHRWVWLVLVVATLVAASVPRRAVQRSGPRRGALLIGIAALLAGLLQVGVLVGRVSTGWTYVDASSLPQLNGSALISAVLLETMVAAAAAAVTLLLGGALVLGGKPAGRVFVICGGAVALAQALFARADVERFFTELGAQGTFVDLPDAALDPAVPLVVLLMVFLLPTDRQRSSPGDGEPPRQFQPVGGQ